MNFKQFQEDLIQLIGDPSPEWLLGNTPPAGTKLKPAVNYGIKQTLDRLVLNDQFKEDHYTKVTIDSTNGTFTLPTDFKMVYVVKNNGYEAEELYHYRHDKKNKKLEFLEGEGVAIPTSIDLLYIQKQDDLVDDTDEVFFDEHFHVAVALFAAERYHLAQFDVANAGQSVAYAYEKMEDLINKYY